MQLCLSKETDYDQIFVLGKYRYVDVKLRLKLIEEYTGNKQSQLRRYLSILKKNAKLTGYLNTKRHSRFIEQIIDDIMINHEENNWNFFWRKSHFITKVHFFYMMLIPLMLFFSAQIEFAEDVELKGQFMFALPALIAATILLAAIVIVTNILSYYIAMSMLAFFKFESGTLNKNVAALESVVDSMKFYKNSVMILAVAGIFGAGLLGKAGGFKGLGGGNFGGGGSGGSW